MTALRRPAPWQGAEAIGQAARDCLRLEIATYPKPGLVSPVDSGAHDDMDAAIMNRSADALMPFFARLAAAGAAGAAMAGLRTIGIEAETAMMAATGGVNTHRGAIFGMGLLCAAAGFRARYGAPGTLGSIVMHRWGPDIAQGPVALRSHGTAVARRYAAGGARAEAAAGFPSLYHIALPALAEGRRLAPADAEAARVHALMALIAGVEDTNLLYRGGAAGLVFARQQAHAFLAEGSVGTAGWRARGIAIHEDFVARRLSAGGCADLLAMALFAGLDAP
ncbi:triphosphoribosyl-dephospho-CoA synthase MdcB [Labrys monachus]|uniref:Probable 2-(5''-triphosphoribosyl)-3'-dephosphocoenzyme-A synthase n=1 Tax=Labrys monachus TaxID=217067 RepID=A0ABU0FPG1_9HYPH|nr:triphosphoribosyl-dephospho-CoA synthase MdcB [Labrys monachus]MDQ0396426.1 triphosphoribosyl-dephospho-CoA synthase [Labrys monachus]